ncbi:MAG: orotate phosphoribosyltransferase [Anaerolineae bacterium]|nr:orotate phosphoribosyltransferase [Anaerolineae bacterium]
MINSLNALQADVARVLLEIDAVIFTPRAPVTFKSGIQSPVYVDNRRLPFWPAQWHIVIDALQQVIPWHGITFEVIAGIEAAGIPHSAALAYALKTPSVFVRKQAKEHGTRRRIEGGDVAGKHVLLIEDMVTTGGSSLSGVEALREAGAVVKDCLCITGYGFKEAAQAFEAAQVRLHVLAPFATIIVEACKMGRCAEDELEILETWTRDPHGWTPTSPETPNS